MNIIEPILFQATLQPRAAAICVPGSSAGIISYGRLVQYIHNISRAIHKLGLPPGKIAAVSIEDPIFQIAVVLALARLGIVTISKYDERIFSAVKIDVLIADKYPALTKINQVILADLSWTRGDGQPLPAEEVHVGSKNDICRIILTSGTTGEPKATAVSQGLLTDRIGRHLSVFGNRLPNCSRVFSDLPVSTSLGFQFLIFTLWRGGTFFLAGDTFETSVQAFEEHRVQCWLSSPGGLETILKAYEQYPTLQSEVEIILVAGDLFSRSLSDRTRARICTHIISIYGSTEASMTATAPAQTIHSTAGAVGFVTPDVAVEIVSEVGARLPPSNEGIVRVKSRFAVDSYIGDPEATAKSFRDGWFYPGDIGALDSANMLRIFGRKDAVLNLGGDKVSPERIEGVVAECKGVIECATFAVPNDFGIHAVWVALAADAKLDDETLRAHCAAHLPAQLRPAGFVRVSRLPRNEMGKIDRGQLLDRYALEKRGTLQG